MTLPLSQLAILGDANGISAAWRDQDLTATLLIMIFGMALGVALVCLLMVLYFLRTGRLGTRQLPHRADYPGHRRFHSLLQGVPCRWLAVRTGNMHWVQIALRLHNPSRCSWEEGLTAAHEQKLFISPPVRGWVLVFGAKLPDPAEDVDRCFHLMAQLSGKLGQVQFFSFNRVLNHHAWVMADQGRIKRAYAWAGHTLWNQGNMTRAEIDLHLRCYDYAESPDRAHLTPGSAAALNTERVPLLAARWSVDPTAINSRMLRESHGIAGHPLRPKTH